MAKQNEVREFAVGAIGLLLIGAVTYMWLTSGGSESSLEASAVVAADAVDATVDQMPEAASGEPTSIDTDEGKVAEQERALQYAHNCLSPWDGSHDRFSKLVSARLNDPDSFDHISTTTWPRREDGRNTIMMTFAAANGFGGTITAKATGSINGDDCSDAQVDEVIQ